LAQPPCIEAADFAAAIETLKTAQAALLDDFIQKKV
jgi:hypothetical protein